MMRSGRRMVVASLIVVAIAVVVGSVVVSKFWVVPQVMGSSESQTKTEECREGPCADGKAVTYTVPYFEPTREDLAKMLREQHPEDPTYTPSTEELDRVIVERERNQRAR